MTNHYGVESFLRRDAQEMRKRRERIRQFNRAFARETILYAIAAMVGACLMIALQSHAAQTPLPVAQPAPAAVDEPPEPSAPVVEPARVIVTARVSAYTSSIDETDEDPGTTASGTTPERGTAACPSKYAFGTRVIIKGKTYICEDRMNARYRNTETFDIWMASKSDAYQWGRQTLKIEIKDV